MKTIGLARPDEAREVLLQIAGRRTQPVPAALMVEHVLGLPGPWDWPVRRAALEAVLRRFASVRAQEIAVVDEPRRKPWGRFRVARTDVGEALRYDVRLWSLSPLHGACDCADFTRASLGLCKHLATVLAHLARNARAFQRLAAMPAASLPQLVWDAAVAGVVAGSADPLLPLRLVLAAGDSRSAPPRIRKLFQADDAGALRLRATHADDPAARLRLVESLRGALAPPAAADPAARAVLSEEQARATRLLRLRAAAGKGGAGGKGGGGSGKKAAARRRLYAYQKEGVRRFLAQGRLVLADDMGLGKTTQAVVAATAMADAGLVRRGLLVVPAALKPQWEREWGAISAAELRVVDGSAGERRALYASTRRGFLVTNYEQVLKDLDAIEAWSPESSFWTRRNGSKTGRPRPRRRSSGWRRRIGWC